MKPPPFDAARRDGSNELRYILLRPLDAEIISGTCLYTKGDQIRRYVILASTIIHIFCLNFRTQYLGIQTSDSCGLSIIGKLSTPSFKRPQNRTKPITGSQDIPP